MLSTNSSSSIQNRRKQHRRQQSLEVPVLGLPAHRQRNPHQQHPHRRGFSLDQSLPTIDTTAGFRPLLPQEHHDHQLSGSPSVRIQLDTNPGPPLDQQHFVQESQQQRPLTAQPGYLPQDFGSHLQQQLNGSVDAHVDFKPVIASPQPQHPQQQRALQELQNHLAWYRDNFSSSPNPAMQNTQHIENGMQLTAGMPGAPVGVGMPLMHSVQAMPVTPISQCNARTVPNTPQTHVQSWPSPPPGGFKHARSQSFQLDVAPMPDSTMNAGLNVPFTQMNNSFGADSVMFSNDGGYASSAYSSSAVDPMSPGRQQQIGPMPTLFEEPPMHDQQASFGHFQGPSLLLQATAGAQDFNDHDFDFGPGALSPRQQLINNLGPDVPASIVETGVAAYEVQQYIGELNEADNKYPCLWEGCSRRFGRKENVRAHVQTHLGDRQFKCNLCDKTFVRQHDLKRHIAIHSDDRPFVCPCGTGFARHDALTRHRQRGMCTGALPGFEKSEEEKPKRGRPKKERPNLEDRTDKASKQRKKNKTKESAGQDDEAELQFNYASSSSGASDRSFPVTPPDTSDDFNTDAFLNMAGGDIQFDNVTASWRDTPPTSPPSASPTKTIDSGNPTFDFNAPVGISPAMLSNASSPPVATGALDAHTPQSNHDIFETTSPSDSHNAGGSFIGGSSPADDNDLFGGFETGISVQPDAVNDAFSPPGESYGGSSVYNYSDNGHVAQSVFDKEYNEFATSVGMDENMFASLMPGMRTDNERVFAVMLEDWVANH